MDTQILTSLPMFSDLTSAELDTVAAFADEATVPAGARLTREGGFGDRLTFIHSGTAVVHKDGEVLGALGEGDVFGEMAVLEDGHRVADVVATSSMRLVTLTHWDVRRLPERVLRRLQGVVAERGAQNARRTALV